VHTATTNQNGTTTLSLAPTLGANQADGTVRFEIKPPVGGNYADRRANTRVLVVADR
jgi:hypothetical protein